MLSLCLFRRRRRGPECPNGHMLDGSREPWEKSDVGHNGFQV